MPRTNLWNRLEELKFPFEMIDVVVQLYETVISNFRRTEGWLKEIKYNTGVKKVCPLSPTLFGISIVKLEDYLEVPGCVG